jgi:hypothetical protein
VTLGIDGAVYLYNSRGKSWRQSAPGSAPYAGECAALARGEDASLLPPFHRFEKVAFMTKHEEREISGERRQERSVAILQGRNSPPESFTVCDVVDDYLPRSYPAYGLEFRYFDWNVPINFTVPQLIQDPRP